MSLGVLGMMGAMLSSRASSEWLPTMSKRLRELGIRVVLGARRKEVLQAALGRAFKLLAIGSGVGLVQGLLATMVLAFIVYQVTPRPAGAGRRGFGYAAVGADRYVDSSPTRSVGQSV